MPLPSPRAGGGSGDKPVFLIGVLKAPKAELKKS